MNKLVLVKQTEFEGTPFDCYIKPKQKDKGEFWATREQIGQLLGYAEPTDAIKKIHKRNRDRLDKLSIVVKLATPSKGGDKSSLPSGNVQEVTLYSFKGLLEICRYSRKPKADAVMDWLWGVADEIRRTGSYSMQTEQLQLNQQDYSMLKAAEQIIHKALKCEAKTDFLEVLALDNVFRETYGKSALEIAHFRLKSDDFNNLEFEFTHPELEELKKQQEFMMELYSDPAYLNMVEEMKYAGRCY